MHIYLSGPMRGRPELNRLSFAYYASQLEAFGHSYYSPWGDEGVELKYHQQESLVRFMARDLSAILSCDAVLLLPGWQDSHGATLERYYAHFVGKPVVDYAGRKYRFTRLRPDLLFLRPGEPVPAYPLPDWWGVADEDFVIAKRDAGVL